MHAARALWWIGVSASVSCAAAPPRPSVRETASADPVQLAYADIGAGSPILFVHGAYGDLRTFRRALPILASTRRVIVPSLRYHWPNPWPGDEEAYRGYTVENHARDLAGLIERLGVGSVDLVAHSYGGNVAVLLALSRPDLVRRLVLLEPAVGWMLREVPGGDAILAKGLYAGDRRERLISRARAGEEPASLMRSLIDGSRPGTFDALPADDRTSLVENAKLIGPYAARPAFDTPFTCEAARRIRQPTLLVHGEKTAESFREIVARFASCAPGARTSVLPGSTHSMQSDAPEDMARIVVAFLGG